MASRLELSKLLHTICNNVYFQQPATIKMKYPAIRYSLSDLDKRSANNDAYAMFKAYEIIVIDSNPDSEIADKIAALPMCSFSRFYTADNLNHFVYKLYY